MRGAVGRSKGAWLRAALGCVLGAALCIGCDDGQSPTPDAGPPLPERFVVAALGAHPDGGLPALQFAADAVNAAGGLLGQAPLELRIVDTTGRPLAEVVGQARALVDDPGVVAIIGPDTSAQTLSVAPLAIAAEKPLLGYRSASPDVLRAFAGERFVWRTRPSGLALVALLTRRARMDGVGRLGLLTAVAPGDDTTFFDWFGFLATAAGYGPDDLWIGGYGDRLRCDAAAAAALDAGLDRLLITAPDADDLRCLMQVLHDRRGPDGALPVDAVLADVDTALATAPAALGEVGAGLRGWTVIFDDRQALDPQWAALRGDATLPALDSGEPALPITVAAAYDAVALVAAGLSASGGRTGRALADGIAAATAGRGAPMGLGPDALADTLAAIAGGAAPDLFGPSGSLDIDPALGVDFQGGRVAEWIVEPAGARIVGVESVADPGDDRPLDAQLRADPAALPDLPPADGAFEPAAARTRLAALLVTTSRGWENYRHQADALARYRRLRARGLEHADIVLIGADDIVDDPRNALAGMVRNVPDGPDVYGDAVYDFPLGGQTPDDIEASLLGAAPGGLGLDGDTDLYVYLVGHGGPQGLALGAESVEDGLAHAGATYTPAMLRQTLCRLRTEGRVRRVFVEVEACYAGVFGDADYDGVEAGCDDGPLGGVLALTATHIRENSLAAGYDLELAAWVGDAFSRAMLDAIDGEPDASWFTLYRQVFRQVAGSHATLYNGGVFGDLSRLPAGAFVSAE